jgi:uncharacterized protein (TIGR00369 family)
MIPPNPTNGPAAFRLLNPDWTRLTAQVINQSPYFSLLSMRLIDLEPGGSRMEIDLGRRHLQPFGVVHGGVFSSLIDAAGFWAAFTEVDEGVGMTTVEMKLNYLAPSISGRLIGLGRLIKAGKTLSLADARVENETGRLLAHGTVTLMTLSGLVLEGQNEAPPKFASTA